MSHGGGRRRKGHEEEEHVNHERWLVTYADMITLLMVLFIVLFAISQVDVKKFAALKDGLAVGFGAKSVVLANSPGQLGQNGTAPSTVDLQGGIGSGGVDSISGSQLKAAVSRAISAKDLAAADAARAQVRAELTKLQQVKAALQAALRKAGLSGDVTYRYDSRGLVVSILTDNVLFHANYAALTTSGERILGSLAPVLRSVPNNLDIEGHTSTEKVKPLYFLSDWELSAARAATVVRYLSESLNVPAERLAATGFGSEHPLTADTSAAAQARNRRVDIVVLTTLPTDEQSLLPQLAASTG